MEFLENGPTDSKTVLLLAHGAGAPMDSPFMSDVAEQVAKSGIRCLRFEFPYMVQRRQEGTKRPPDRQPKLLECFRKAVHKAVESSPENATLFIGGKSMGGRMATLLIAEYAKCEEDPVPKISGVVCLGYPFHPPGKPEKRRVDHFPDIPCPVLICQGERDAFGTADEIGKLSFPKHFQTVWLPDGNHDLAPRKKSGYTKEGNMSTTIAEMVRFLTSSQG